jgi:hypothetical protein
MSGDATVEVCDNCGSPLDLDFDGRCRWCHAHVQIGRLGQQRASLGPDSGLVPDGVDDCSSSAPFLYMLLSALGPGLSPERAVQDYLHQEPAFRQAVRALATAVSQAGVRVRDAGLLRGDSGDRLKVFIPEEIWTFDLAVDVVRMLCELDGLTEETRARISENVGLVDQERVSHLWRKGLKKAGDGPDEFRELRYRVIRHSPSPVYISYPRGQR